MSQLVIIIGASEKPNRYANMAMHSLIEHGHEVYLVNPYKSEIEGFPCYRSVADIADEIADEIDTVTLYVNPTRFHDHIDEVIKARPKRIIMNPGTEDSEVEKRLSAAGISVLRACTLVMLNTGQF
jgi:predicted CoA-binding protein